jgi:type I restriction enzyme, S subunit
MIRKLSDISEFIIDTKHNTPEYADEGYPCIRTPNIGCGYFDLDNVRYVSETTYEKWTERAAPKEGDLILAREAPIGNVAWIPPGLKVCIGQRTVLIRPLKEIVDSRYLNYYLLSDECQNRMHSLSGGATVAHLNMSDIRAFEVHELPTMIVQKQIAAILSAYDDLIENNLRRIKILEEMAQNLYREWFVNFRFPGHEQTRFVDSPLGRIPKGWEVVKLGNVADVSWGDTTTTKKSYTKEGFLAFSASGPDGKLDHYDYDRTGIVLSAIGANCGLTWFAKGQWSCIKNTIRFWGINPQISTEYLYYTTYGKDFWPKRGAAQPFISQGDAKNILIIAPESTISFKFKDIASKIIDLILCLSERNNTLRQTRDMLLPKIVSGEVDVSELDIKIMDEEAV